MAQLTAPIVVTGATGRQGFATARHLLKNGQKVRALVRNPQAAPAQTLARLGAELVVGDMNKPDTLHTAFTGAVGVYSLQSPHAVGFDTEIQQGKNVADAAKATGVAHVVQASAGTGQKTGIPSWDSKLQIQAHMQSLDLPLTILRPMAFMELMTDPTLYPSVAAFYTMPKLMGADKGVPWVAADDLGAVAAQVFANPSKHIGQDYMLASDIKTNNEVRAIYHRVMGKKPRWFPIPLFMFRKFTGDDLIIMWSWLRTATLDVTPDTMRAILPEAQTVETWLMAKKTTE